MDATVKILLSWYRRHGRDLPWRSTRDSYRIFMSELMLQQTQVDRVIPKYRAWLKIFPSWTSLSNAKTADLIHAWAGLGYNRRALYAREAAKTVRAKGVPHTEAEWRALKGVGPYVAAALTEFVNGKRAIVIDTNIRRVIGRLFLGKPFPSIEHDRKIGVILERITPIDLRHRDLPQALMDFANAVCLPRTPRCAECPLQTSCRSAKAFLSGRPILRTKKRVTERMYAEKSFPDRIYRGRILALLRAKGPTKISTIGSRIDSSFDRIADTAWLSALIDRLVADGLLAEHRRGIVSLPNS